MLLESTSPPTGSTAFRVAKCLLRARRRAPVAIQAPSSTWRAFLHVVHASSASFENLRDWGKPMPIAAIRAKPLLTGAYTEDRVWTIHRLTASEVALREAKSL